MEIILEHVSKTIKGNEVLQDVSLTMKSGKIYGLSGINGSGKTMLMRMVTGLIHPSKGKVRIDGKVLGKEIDYPEGTGMLLENPVFLKRYTGHQNLKLLAELSGRTTATQIKDSLMQVGLKPQDKRTFRKYSLGMKQRLGIASAIMGKPRLLILDEPFNALDEGGIERISTIISRERDRGALIILSCHDRELLEKLSDELYKMQEGRIEKVTV